MDLTISTGYTIPAGWIILLYPAALQLDPNTFADPLTFNPWRWKVFITIFFKAKISHFHSDFQK